MPARETLKAWFEGQPEVVKGLGFLRWFALACGFGLKVEVGGFSVASRLL